MLDKESHKNNKGLVCIVIQLDIMSDGKKSLSIRCLISLLIVQPFITKFLESLLL